MTDKNRRDFLLFATSVAGVAGASLVAWPFIDQLQKDDAVLASSMIEVDISTIEEGKSVTVKWRGQPVLIRNRSKQEIENAKSISVNSLKDKLARNLNLETGTLANDSARAAGEGRENWLIVINLCTHLGCVPLENQNEEGGFICPCHGSQYDSAGRVCNGPAEQNLAIPPYRFVSDTLVQIG